MADQEMMTLSVPVSAVKAAIKWENDRELRQAHSKGYSEGWDAALASLTDDPYNAMISRLLAVKSRCQDITSDDTKSAGERINAAHLMSKVDTLYDVLRGGIDEQEFNDMLRGE